MKITGLNSCCVDVFPDLDAVYVGGNSLNYATQCILSGIDDVSIMGEIGKDRFGVLILQHFDKNKINRSHLYCINAPTASNKIYLSDNGDCYFKENSWNGGAFNIFRLSEEDWNYLKSRDIVAMPAGDPNLLTLLEKRDKRQLVVIDFLDYHTLDFIADKIDRIDITFLSADEKMLDDLNNLAIKSGKLIVATLGAKGSVAFWNKSTYFQDVINVDNIINTTGCGDAFQAAFQ